MNEFEKIKNTKNLRKGIKVLRGLGVEDNDQEKKLGIKNLDHMYEYYDSPLLQYDEHFKKVLEPHKSIQEYVLANYNKPGKLIGIELGGPGHKLFSEFDHNIFTKTAGFTLNKLKNYEGNNLHDIVEADIFFRNNTWLTIGERKLLKKIEQKIEKLKNFFSNENFKKKSWKDIVSLEKQKEKLEEIIKKLQKSWNQVEYWVSENGKPDIIIERMVGPLFFIRDPKVFLLIFARWYSILDEGGTMFIEVPKAFKKDDYIYIIVYLKRLQIENKTIEIKFDINLNIDNLRDRAIPKSIMLKKLTGAPEQLRFVL